MSETHDIEQFAADLALEMARSLSLEQTAHSATCRERDWFCSENRRLRRMLTVCEIVAGVLLVAAIVGWVR
jgi:hypothetical protein